eukprot:12939220-Prorocentrum_lima.AAC.1
MARLVITPPANFRVTGCPLSPCLLSFHQSGSWSWSWSLLGRGRGRGGGGGGGGGGGRDP